MLLIGGGLVGVALLLVGSIIMVFMLAITGEEQTTTVEDEGGVTGTANVSPAVQRWEPLVRKYTKAEGLSEDLVPIVLALIQQESGGTHADVMQSSESQGHPPGYFTDPETSIKFGMKHFANVYRQAKGDVKLVLQSYNYGTGFINYVLPRKYSLDLAKQFSIEQARKNGYTCRAWRSAEEKSKGMCYGDPYYVDHVLRYVKDMKSTGGGGKVAKGSPLGDDKYKALMEEAYKYQGQPYVWAGSNPNTGFDCSGLMQWSYRKIGINLPRTAQEQYNATARIKDSERKPGDLVFFTRTYKTSNYITHVGIYIGNDEYYNSSGRGIGPISLKEKFWQDHFVGYGRIKK
ncbi:bifunctional lytic transglycosylase/C40 family peptidase [Priestia sp. SB1]|uniref:bifunctional lytic transglycosylase/C40 family peptidase n=1 Tax=Priestia sp. SB1 TaxID=3132359 RepID=UPI00316B8A07